MHRAPMNWDTGSEAEAASMKSWRIERVSEAAWPLAEQRCEETGGIQATDDRTLVVRLTRPLPYFLDLVALGRFCPVHRPSVEGWVLDRLQTARLRETGWPTIETPPFDVGTRQVAEGIVKATEAGAVSVVGGGETAAAVEGFGLSKRFSHVSTGGGASLQMLEGRSFDSVAVLDEAWGQSAGQAAVAPDAAQRG